MIAAAIQIAVVYGLFAFMALDLDPTSWSNAARGWFAVIAVLLFFGNLPRGRK